MGASMLDGQDALLGGRAFAEEVWAEFMKEWLGPLVETSMELAWMSAPAGAKEALKRSNPDEYELIARRFEGGRNG